MTLFQRTALVFTLATGFLISSAAAQQADSVWDRITGSWEMDFEQTAKLPEIKEADQEKIRAAGGSGIKIHLKIGEGTAKVTITIPDQEPQVVDATWKLLSSDAKGAFFESITSSGDAEKRERASVTYVADGMLKYTFSDLDYPIVLKRLPK